MLISQIGCGLASRVNIEYVDEDFKKKDGFQRSIELAKKYELYRQYYCGCEYSKQKKR
jgi:predicted adenine nucleotide alpha hydrolase (AANH) superfamily ATPase